MNQELVERLRFLADKYETKDFIKKDPSLFMHGFSSPREQEVVAFVAASLAFGRREQILSHVQSIVDDVDKKGGSVCSWIEQSCYDSFFLDSDTSFYRMFSHNTMRLFFSTIRDILIGYGSLGNFFHHKYKESPNSHLFTLISDSFPVECTIIPHSKDTSAKRINMFLRWMVRDNSPVDLGLWNWYDKSSLLMPLDTHVMQEATKLGILSTSASGKIKAASLKTALELTKLMEEPFPNDPVKADYALFGLGVDSAKAFV